MTTKQIKVTTQQSIPLGRQGENDVLEVLFVQPDELMGENWQLNHQRATDREAYPCPLEKRDNALVWKVTSGDTAISGIGNAELTCYGQNGQVLKSRIYNTCVLKSLTTGGEVPDVVKPWYDDLLEKIKAGGTGGGGSGTPGADGEDGGYYTPAISQVDENTMTVSFKASGADMPAIPPVDITLPEGPQGKQGMQGPAGATGSQGPRGETGAAGKDGVTPTIGDNGNWYIGDTDTGKPSRGATGAAGKDGAAGAAGKDGSPGKDGADGTSVTVASVTESAADGGSNVVKFSDGKSVTIKNGSKGSTGAQGPKGDTGATGPAGAAGAKGEKGDTGPTGPQGADGYTPVKGTDYWTEADKQEILDDLELVLSGVPAYWKTALETGAEGINTALCTAGANKSAFLFYSDAHWNYGSQMSPVLLKYLYQHTGMTKTFFGGDIVNDEGTDYDTMEYLWQWRKQLKDLPNHHSVVGNHDDGNSTNNLFSEAYIYGYLLAPEETPDITRESSGLWYYIDSPAEKTRYLFLDTAYKGATDAQLTFVKEALLSTPGKWHIVVVSHIWYDPDYDQYDQRPVPIKGMNADATKIIALLDAYNSRTGDYADCGGWVEFCIGGHCHYDYDGSTTTGIPIVLVETDSKHLRDNLTFTAGTTSEASVNGIVADYTSRTLHVIRVGRGESRDVILPASAAMLDYTNVLDTVGYTENKRLSPSSAYAEKDGTTDLTGFIPINAGDIIYMKNVVMPSTDTSGYTNMAYLFDSSKTGVNSIHLTTSQTDMGVVADSSGNVIQFTVPQKHLTGTSGYLRIGASDITAASIITVNEPIG